MAAKVAIDYSIVNPFKASNLQNRTTRCLTGTNEEINAAKQRGWVDPSMMQNNRTIAADTDKIGWFQTPQDLCNKAVQDHNARWSIPGGQVNKVPTANVAVRDNGYIYPDRNPTTELFNSGLNKILGKPPRANSDYLFGEQRN